MQKNSLLNDSTCQEEKKPSIKDGFSCFVQPACKPGSVSAEADPCHLSMRPTPRYWAGHPQSPVYLVLQPARRTAPDVATRTGELLPHLFTLIPTKSSGRLFSVPLLCPHEHLLFRSTVPIVARTFLPGPMAGVTEQHAAVQKYQKTLNFRLLMSG